MDTTEKNENNSRIVTVFLMISLILGFCFLLVNVVLRSGNSSSSNTETQSTNQILKAEYFK